MMTECQLRIMIAALLRGTVGRLAHGMGAEALPACRIKPQTNRDQMTRYNPNVYEQQILAKGRDLDFTPAPAQQFPKTIHGRTFETQADYDEAMADFLNGN